MKDFKLVSQFNGYRNKRDITNMGDGFLVTGSQNVISTDGDRMAARMGYTLDGAANASLFPIRSSYEWNTHTALQIPLRSYDDELEYRYNGTWYRLANSWTSIAFNFAEFWDTAEGQDILLFVNGTPNIYQWSGGITTFASATINTITKQGTTTWAEDRFLTTGTRQVIIGGITYTYTGGESTTTLTGVTPDPTLGGHTVGAVIHQAIRTTANTPAAGFNNHIIVTLDNQVWFGDINRRDVYKSAVNTFTTFSFSSPRLVGEGALLTLDSPPVGFVAQEKELYISGTKSDWYQTEFELSSDLQNETIKINRLKTAPQTSATSQSAIAKIKNQIAFISSEPTLDTLGRIESVDTPQSVPLSDPIKTDFDSYDFTNVHMMLYKSNLYIALPVESLLLIYNLQKAYWEAPQVLPAGRLAIIDDLLYLHSNSVPETYKLFDGYNDNGAPIDARAVFSYQNFGRRDWQKDFDEFYTEGYISSNTDLTLTINYDYEGYTQIQEFDISGSNDTFLFKNTNDGSLGKNSLGKANLGGSLAQISDVLPPKFRIIHTMPRTDFYEMQVKYSSYEVDQRWELLAFGPAAILSKADNCIIKL